MPRAHRLTTDQEQAASLEGAVAFLEENASASEGERVTTKSQLADQDFSDEELEALLLREITIDGMCGVY